MGQSTSGEWATGKVFEERAAQGVMEMTMATGESPQCLGCLDQSILLQWGHGRHLRV